MCHVEFKERTVLLENSFFNVKLFRMPGYVELKGKIKKTILKERRG